MDGRKEGTARSNRSQSGKGGSEEEKGNEETDDEAESMSDEDEGTEGYKKGKTVVAVTIVCRHMLSA